MFGYDPEAIYQDVDIELLEMLGEDDVNSWKCGYNTCMREQVVMGVCQQHRDMEVRDMERQRAGRRGA